MALRGYGEGSITERRDTSGKVIGYQVQVLLPGGKRKTLGTVKTKREATKLARGGVVDAAAGKLSAAPRQTLETYLDAWLETKRPDIRYKTAVTYQTAIGHAKRHIGHVKLDGLRPEHIEALKAALRKEKGARTVHQVFAVLHNALHQAEQLDLIFRNPTERVKAPRWTPTEKQRLSLEQAHQLFEATEGEWLHALWVVVATCGLRINEALGLTWVDFDLERRTLTVRHAQERQTGKGLLLGELKTEKSRRVVPLMAVAVDALRAHKIRQTERRLKEGPAWIDSGRMFTTDVGTPLDPAHVRTRYLYPALQRAGLSRVTPHELRHTASSVMADEAIPKHWIQAVMGHANSTTTENIYTHVLPASLREVATRMDAAYARVQAAEKAAI